MRSHGPTVIGVISVAPVNIMNIAPFETSVTQHTIQAFSFGLSGNGTRAWDHDCGHNCLAPFGDDGGGA